MERLRGRPGGRRKETRVWNGFSQTGISRDKVCVTHAHTGKPNEPFAFTLDAVLASMAAEAQVSLSLSLLLSFCLPVCVRACARVCACVCV